MHNRHVGEYLEYLLDYLTISLKYIKELVSEGSNSRGGSLCN